MLWLKRLVWSWRDLVLRTLRFLMMQARGKTAMCLVFLTLLVAVASGIYLKDRSFGQRSNSDRRVIHRHMVEVYKKAKLNSDGTLSVKIHNRKIHITRVVGYQLLQGGQKWSENEASFRFNTSDLLLEKGSVMAAEFQLMARPSFPKQPINVTVYVKKTMPKQPNMLVSLGWQVLHRRPHALVSFDVREAIHYWQYTHQVTGELLIRVRRLDTSGGNMSKTSTHTHALFRSGMKNGPCLVVYLAENSPGPEEVADSTLLESLKTQSIQLPDGSGRNRRGQDYCRKVDLEINLNDLYKGSKTTFIVPTRINAGLCTGRCIYPLNHAVSPTSHAIVMLMMYIKNGVKNRERPYCVPSHYRAMSVLTMDENNHVKIELWKTALVKNCGCR